MHKGGGKGFCGQNFSEMQYLSEPLYVNVSYTCLRRGKNSINIFQIYVTTYNTPPTLFDFIFIGTSHLWDTQAIEKLCFPNLYYHFVPTFVFLLSYRVTSLLGNIHWETFFPHMSLSQVLVHTKLQRVIVGHIFFHIVFFKKLILWI